MLIGRREMIAGGLALGVAGKLSGTAALDVAFVGGSVWTGHPALPRSDAIGIIGDRIACVGAAAVRVRTSPRTRIVRLDGAFAVPGFIDSHVHFLKGAMALGQPELLKASNRAELAAIIGAAARANPGQWITGQGWDDKRLGAVPTREWIDSVTPNTPVAVPRTDLHMLLLNSVALRLAGIDRNTPDPAGGAILRDANGDPTGIIKDNANNLVLRVIPPLSPARQDEAMRKSIALGHSHGLTQVHVPEINWECHDALRRSPIAREQGFRFYSFVPIADWRRMADIVASEGRGDDWVRWGAVKGLADGSLGSRTALFHEPYTDDPKTSGVRILQKADLHEYVQGADAAKLQVAVHAIGDLANDDVLDIYRDVATANGRRDRRFRIEHAQHLRPAAIPRFREQGVIASVQPYHAIDDGRWAVDRIGAARLAGTYAFGSLIRSGAHVSFGSDWPVAPLDPITGIHAAVTRETIDGANPGGWLPDQKVTVEQALTAYTVGNAYAGFQEDRVGRIAPGFLADITIVDRDLTRIPADDIRNARIRSTWVGGVERYAV